MPASAKVLGSVPVTASWTPPVGHADIAPSHFKHIEGDGYLTLDAPWIVPALLRSVPIAGRVLEPAAGRGHLSRELKRAGYDVTSFDLKPYADPLVDDITIDDIRALEIPRRFAWVITNYPIAISRSWPRSRQARIRNGCSIALLVGRNGSFRKRVAT